MNRQHIEDQVIDYALEVAREAYLLGMKHTQDLYSNDKTMPSQDDVNDVLKEITREKLHAK